MTDRGAIQSAFNGMMFNGLENNMVIGDYYKEKPEPTKTEIECFCCGQLYEGANYQVFTQKDTDKEVIICEDCQDTTKWKSAWND